MALWVVRWTTDRTVRVREFWRPAAHSSKKWKLTLGSSKKLIFDSGSERIKLMVWHYHPSGVNFRINIFCTFPAKLKFVSVRLLEKVTEQNLRHLTGPQGKSYFCLMPTYRFVLARLVWTRITLASMRSKWMLRTEDFAKRLELLDFDGTDHLENIFTFLNTELAGIVDCQCQFLCTFLILIALHARACSRQSSKTLS